MNDRDRSQQTSYTGKDTSVSITQTQDTDQSQSQFVFTNDRLRGEWSPRVIYRTRRTDTDTDTDSNNSTHDSFYSFSALRVLQGARPGHGEKSIHGYALVRPNTRTLAGATFGEMVDQYHMKSEAYVYNMRQPVPIPQTKGFTSRFVIQQYHVSHRRPSTNGWVDNFTVCSAQQMISSPHGFRIAAVAEVPPRTSFPYPFHSPRRLKETLEDRAEAVHFNPDFRRIA